MRSAAQERFAKRFMQGSIQPPISAAMITVDTLRWMMCVSNKVRKEERRVVPLKRPAPFVF
jgi:hypothetical protein